MKRYVIGVDGGSTKTHYALFDDEGNLVNFLRGGSTNYVNVAGGFEGVRRELEEKINMLLEEPGLSVGDIGYGVFGMAGVDITEQKELVSDIVRQLGINNYYVENDAFLGIKAGCSKGYGICSINGTGTCCVGIDGEGNRVQIGGTGFVFGDFAGAGFIGQMVVLKVYDSMYRCGVPTIMKDMLYKEIGIKDEEDIVEAFYRRGYPKFKFDSLSRIAFFAANEGDEAALEILRFVGREAAKSAAGAARNLKFPEDEPIEIVLAGSQYVKGENPALVEEFKKTARSLIDRETEFILLETPPVTGAVLWALELLKGGSLDQEIRRKVTDILINANAKNV